jgi:hypothetical protein
MAVKINPNLSAAYYTLGSVYRHLGLEGMSREALENFEKAKPHRADDPVETAIHGPEAGAGEWAP